MLKKVTACLISIMVMNGFAQAAKVGVVKKGYHQGVYECLKGDRNFSVEYIPQLNEENLLKYNAVVIPVCGGRGTITEQERIALNAYAYSGGGVLVLGQAIGPFRWQIPLFPEVGEATGRINDHVITIINKTHPVCKDLPAEIITSYYDHMILTPGSLGQPLAGDRAGHITGLYAKVGEGEVILLGAQSGLESNDLTCQPRDDEKKMLINAIGYLSSKSKELTNYEKWESVVCLRRDIENNYTQMKHSISKMEKEIMIPLEVLNYRLTEAKMPLFAESGMEEAERSISALKREALQFYQDYHNKTTILLGDEEITRIRSTIKEKKEAVVGAAGKLKEEFTRKREEAEKKAGTLPTKAIAPGLGESGWEKKTFPIVSHLYGAGLWPERNYVPYYAKDLGLSAVILRNYDITNKDLFEEFGRQGIRIFPGYFPLTDLSKLESCLEKQIKEISFAGYQSDEPQISSVSLEQFKEYLKAKHSPARLKKFEVDLDTLSLPQKAESDRDKFLSVEFAECRMKTMEDRFVTADTWLKSQRRDLSVMATINQGARAPEGCPFSLASKLKLTSTDHYQNGCLETAFLGDLLRANAKGNSAFLCVAPFYDESVKRWKTDLASAIAHGDGCHIFTWSYIFKYPFPTPDSSHYMMPERFWQFKEGVWEVTKELTTKMRKLEEYLVNTTSPASVGLVFSRRSKVVESTLGGKNWPDFGNLTRQYFYNQEGVYQALVANHLPFEVVYAECLTPENIKKFGVLILNEATSLGEGQIELIRAWVKAGGWLIAGGKTTLYDEWGIKRKDYALADVFGVKHLSTVTKGKAVFSTPAGEAIYHSQRDVDKIATTTGKVIGNWQDEDIALVENSFGKGGSFFVGASELGMCFKGASLVGRNSDLFKEYYPGVKELINWLARESLKDAGEKLLLEVENCPELVEVVVKQQPGRYIIHFTNYSYQDTISQVLIKLNTKAIKRAVYPFDNSLPGFEKGENSFSLKIRDFAVHEMVVVEW